MHTVLWVLLYSIPVGIMAISLWMLYMSTYKERESDKEDA